MSNIKFYFYRLRFFTLDSYNQNKSFKIIKVLKSKRIYFNYSVSTLQYYQAIKPCNKDMKII